MVSRLVNSAGLLPDSLGPHRGWKACSPVVATRPTVVGGCRGPTTTQRCDLYGGAAAVLGSFIERQVTAGIPPDSSTLVS